MDLRRLRDPLVLGVSFDPPTLQRARDYAGARVLHLEVAHRSSGTVRAQAEVHGSGRRPYLTTLEAWVYVDDLEEADITVETFCSCPVRLQCKHGAAVAMTVGGTLEPARPQDLPEAPSWRDRVDDVLRELTPPEPPPGGFPPLALRLTYDRLGGGAYADGTGPSVRLRPMRRGRRGWVQAGIDWHGVRSAVSDGLHDPDQLAAVAALARTLDVDYYRATAGRLLTDFGPDLLRLLAEAEAAGVTLYAERPLRGLRLLDDRAHLGADATRDRDGVRIDLGIHLDGALRTLDELVLFGAPVHSVAFVDDEDVLVLATLAEPIGPGALRSVRTAPVVAVPAGQVDEVPDVLRSLRRTLRVTSYDASVEVPDAVDPTLRVRVVWSTAASAQVSWSWRYGAGEHRCCAVEGPEHLDGLRDRAAERRVLATLDLDPRDRTVTGADTVELALLELPAWRERDDVEVVEVDAPDVRPAQEVPEISFELVDPPEPSSPPTHGESTTDWLDLEVVITVDGERVPLPDLLAALTHGADHLMLPSGLYVSTALPEFAALAESVRSAAELHDRHPDGQEVRISREDVGVLADLGDLGRVDDRVERWLERARALRDLTDLPHPEPTGVTTTLRPYQLEGFAWLAFLWQHRLGGVLADDMGLGKTLQVLALVAHARSRPSADTADTAATGPFLVVAPTSVVPAWVAEAARHSPGLVVRAVEGTASRRDASLAELADGADVVVTTYTLLRLETDQYAATSWGGLVLDEAQQVKNHTSQAYAAIRSLRAPFALAVTGTPFENRLMELWSLLSIVVPGLYPVRRRFAESVSRPIEKEGDDAALDRFRRRIRAFVLRRTKEAVAPDLPPKVEQELAVTLAPRHRALYDSRLAKEQQRVLGLLADFDENRIEVLAALTRLRQMSLDPGLVDPAHDRVGSAKLDALLEHLGEVVAEGHRALVFSSFTGFLARARERLEDAGLAYAYLDGSTTDRGEVIEGFRTGSAPVFLISLKAGGVGLTLTEADYVFVLDPWWNPAAEAQAVDRAHRIGQQRTVMVYRLVATDTIEEKVMALKAAKADLFARVVDGGGATSSMITADDIRRLFE